MSVLTSRENPKVKRWAKLVQDARYRRIEKRVLIEGPHLLAAALQHGHKPVALLVTEKATVDPEISRLIRQSGVRPVVVAERVFRGVVDAETPQGVAAEIAILAAGTKHDSRIVFLEGVQDPSNVGAIIRSAAAFGVGQVVLDQECADPWSPKALRAAMGGHFSLQIRESGDLGAEIEAFGGTVACTVPRGGVALSEAPVNRSWGWIFGGEGRGLRGETIRRSDLRVTIPMAAGTESLNVAAAAAICLYETFKKGS